ncbi:MAG: carbohydrate-binding protein [Chthoniobacterales bacterium]|nr:carbohydrate-binding protein [Chthoniobacterales bacterium]
MSAADFMAVSPGVSWWYNWHYADTQNPPPAAHMEFLPMAWGHAEDVNGLRTYLASHKPSHVLAINEPNLKGQAFIPPQKTADYYKQVKSVADSFHIPVVGPHMALGSGTGASIKAMDPVEHKEMTYTFMTPFLKAVMFYLANTEVTATSAHTYGNFGELKWMVGMMHDTFKKPVWVTEFAQWNASGPEAERDYLIQSVDLFERTPYVEGYAWFKERVKGNPKLSLLDSQSGKLTELGETYVNMPVHDPNVYYQLPGRLQSESYVEAKDSDLGLTKDSDGFLEMQMLDSGHLDYNVAVPSAGAYSLNVRFAGSGTAKIQVLAGAQVLATAQATTTGWQTATTQIQLPAGNQKLTVKSDSAVRLNWMEFSK